MRISIFALLTFLTAILLGSCVRETQESAQTVTKFIDLQALLDQQVDLLLSKDALLIKKANLKGLDEEFTVRPDSAGWATQFQVFTHNDLNKPSLFDAYEIVEAQPSPTSNLLITSYIPINPKKVQVKSMNVHYLNDQDNLRIVEIHEAHKNELYEIDRNLKLGFDRVDGQIVLQSFRIDGFQKVATRDTVHYRVDAEVRL